MKLIKSQQLLVAFGTLCLLLSGSARGDFCYTLWQGTPCTTSGALVAKTCDTSQPNSGEVCNVCGGNVWYYSTVTFYPMYCSMFNYVDSGKTGCTPYGGGSTSTFACSTSYKMVIWVGSGNNRVAKCVTYWTGSDSWTIQCEIDSLYGDDCQNG